MDVNGGGWTVIQHREDGSLDFQRGWKEYKMGFGNPSGEYWLGNEFIFAITSQRQYMLRIELMDWEGNRAYSQYDRFHIGNEKQNYRLYLKGHTGTAGKQSSLILHGADFSTKDADNDNCMCKCALMLTGGWWFDACGPSNLNGMFYTAGQNHGKLNGIKWHYFKGPSYSLRSTTMMIRPLDFWRCHASIRKLQRNLGMFPDEKLFRGFRCNEHCLPSSSKWLCHVTGYLTMDLEPSEVNRIATCIQRMPLTIMFKREETSQLAALQSATGSHSELLTSWCWIQLVSCKSTRRRNSKGCTWKKMGTGLPESVEDGLWRWPGVTVGNPANNTSLPKRDIKKSFVYWVG